MAVFSTAKTCAMYYIIANKLHLDGKNAAKADIVKAVFGRAGIEHKLLLTDHAGHATDYAREITSDGNENTIIAMGGDGTMHEILNGFVDFGKNSLGLIPFGTGNDFATAAGIPVDIKEAAEIIAFRDPSHIDFIQLSSGLRSLNSVGMGIDTEVLKRVYSGGKSGKSKYFRSLLATVFNFKGFPITVEYNGESEKHFALIAALGNGNELGGGIKLFPEAKINDGYMDLIIVDYISRPKLMAALLKLQRGKVNSIKEAKAVRVKKAKFSVDEENFTIQAEGELYENVPIDAEIVSDKLKFYL